MNARLNENGSMGFREVYDRTLEEFYRPRELNDRNCPDPEHKPPSHLCLQPGQTHTHVCPHCGVKIRMRLIGTVKLER